MVPTVERVVRTRYDSVFNTQVDRVHCTPWGLEGGGAACGNDESDWYGKLAVSWSNDGSNPCSSLSPHLDPNGTGTPTSIAGYDLNAAGGTTLPLSDACYRADGGGDNGGAIGGGSSGSLLLTWLAPLLLAGWWRRRRGLRGKH